VNLENKITYFQVVEVAKTIKDEFAYTKGKGKEVKRMILTHMGGGNFKLETYYY